MERDCFSISFIVGSDTASCLANVQYSDSLHAMVAEGDRKEGEGEGEEEEGEEEEEDVELAPAFFCRSRRKYAPYSSPLSAADSTNSGCSGSSPIALARALDSATMCSS